jgi:hypothetical protein
MAERDALQCMLCWWRLDFEQPHALTLRAQAMGEIEIGSITERAN